MSLRIRQIVFAARHLAATVEQFENVLGLQVAYRDPQVAEFGVENAIFPIGDQFLEIVSPTQDNTAAGRHLERHGNSAYMLIFQTDDLTRDRARLKDLSVREIWQSSYPDIRAVHLHPKDIGAAIVSIDQPMPPESWRWAGSDWKKHISKDGAQRICEATIGSRDPLKMARRWSEVLGTEAPVESHTGSRISISISISEGALNFAPADTDRIIDYGIAVNNLQATLSAARAHDLPVTDRTVTLGGTRFVLTPH